MDAKSFRDIDKDKVGKLITIRFGRQALLKEMEKVGNTDLIPMRVHTALVFDETSGIAVGGIAYTDRLVYAYSMVEGLLPKIRKESELKW